MGCWLLLALLVVAACFGWREYQRLMREYPERFPWTALEPRDPIGRFTGAKLAALARRAPRMPRACCAAAGDRSVRAPPRRRRAALRLSTTACASARTATARSLCAARPGHLLPGRRGARLWERDVVQPAAARHFGEPRRARSTMPAAIQLPPPLRPCGRRRSASMRRPMRSTSLGFRLADGRRISACCATGRGRPAEAAFLRDVRDGACDLFATVLSPDYNAAHADHLHFDLAERGRSAGALPLNTRDYTGQRKGARGSAVGPSSFACRG